MVGSLSPTSPGFTHCTAPEEGSLGTHQVGAMFYRNTTEVSNTHGMTNNCFNICRPLCQRSNDKTILAIQLYIFNTQKTLIITIIIITSHAQLIIWSCIFQDAHTFPILGLGLCTFPPPTPLCPYHCSSSHRPKLLMSTSI